MIGMIEVVVAPEERKEEIWQLYLEYAQEMALYDGEKRPIYSNHHYPCFDEYWEDESSIPFLVLYDHEPIGFCFLEDTGMNYRIAEFYIRQLHRRRGFGKVTVDYIKDYCRKHGKHKIITANTYVNNDSALRFWQSLGFRDTGRRVRVKHIRLIETELDLSKESEQIMSYK